MKIMKIMKAINIDATIGEITERELTPEEIAQQEAMQNEVQPETQQTPTLEQRVTDIEQVTTEVITVLNDKGIIV